MFILNTYGAGVDAKSLYMELDLIIRRYRKELHACNVRADIETLKWAIEKSINGSAAATYYLAHHGARMLGLIREQLFLSQGSNQQMAA